jgi:catechol-2,3-dioxygenase
MTTSESQPTSSSQLISPATRLGHVHLTVADLERQRVVLAPWVGDRCDPPRAGSL